MKGYIANIEKETLENELFRKVVYTGHFSQLVIMCLRPLEEIGEEVHELDQFIRVEAGMGRVVLDGVGYEVLDGSAVLIPAHLKHNVVNTSPDKPLKLYSLYSPPEHKDGTIHPTKEGAVEEHFDGITTE